MITKHMHIVPNRTGVQLEIDNGNRRIFLPANKARHMTKHITSPPTVISVACCFVPDFFVNPYDQYSHSSPLRTI